ncbi:hypothetical protein [Streptomyces scabiei]|uniref:hypothetical protein n=1 Tax=Streptomyces scabiei TaxID=1930 RepID=UPI0029BD4824|nr:hypothetical protein [Streptomyces scabiei]MDX3520778.1 hypothetical protein [Streptomyces scabiei]
MIRTDRGDMTVHSPAEVQVRLDALRAEIEREVRWQIAADFKQFGKRQDTLSWGEAALIAREGLCRCRGGSQPREGGGQR